MAQLSNVKRNYNGGRGTDAGIAEAVSAAEAGRYVYGRVVGSLADTPRGRALLALDAEIASWNGPCPAYRRDVVRLLEAEVLREHRAAEAERDEAHAD